MDKTLQFWVDVACEHIKREHGNQVIRCTSDPRKVDKRTRSKWSRALRYAISGKPIDEPLDRFIKRRGGINKCAAQLRRANSIGGRWRARNLMVAFSNRVK
jgi:hypothetical protein